MYRFYGATVTSWKTGGKERLFVSKKAHLDGSAAVSFELTVKEWLT